MLNVINVLNTIKFYFRKILENFLNFCANFINFKKISSLQWVHFCWMSHRIEILATPLQYRTWVEFMYKILSDVPPQTKILESLLVQLYIVHYSCIRAVQYLNERKMGMQFYVIKLILIWYNISKQLYSTNFIIHWFRARPGKTKFCRPCRKFRPGWHL